MIIMQENKEETTLGKNLCDLVYQNITSQSHCSTIHRSQVKGRLTSVPNTTNLYKTNRRTIDLKGWREDQSPIVCNKYKGSDAEKHNQYTFHCSQATNKTKITKVTISQLKGLSANTTKRSKTKLVTNFATCEKMIGFQSREYSKKENKRGYQKQKQRFKVSNIKLSNFFSKYDRVNSFVKMQNNVESLRSQIIKKYSSKFKLLQSL